MSSEDETAVNGDLIEACRKLAAMKPEAAGRAATACDALGYDKVQDGRSLTSLISTKQEGKSGGSGVDSHTSNSKEKCQGPVDWCVHKKTKKKSSSLGKKARKAHHVSAAAWMV